MSDSDHLQRYVNDPSLLVELCKHVIEQLDSGSGELVSEQETQLLAISKAVEQLEKLNVAVPDPLRAEKARLVASLSVNAEANQALAILADELHDILADLRERLGKNGGKAEAKARRKRANLPKTPRSTLREYILRALKKLGGRAPYQEVLAEMAKQLDGKLLPGDTSIHQATNEPAWQYSSKWTRFQMVQDGELRRGSPRGIWELEEGHK